jgi:predicted HicB family RNase H-like nuclease
VALLAGPREIRQKRLTIDLAPELHRALKVRAAELDVPMSELLRALIEQALNEPSTLSKLADDLRRT